MERSDVRELVVGALRSVLEGAEQDQFDENTRLLGREAVLDSLGMVNLIVEVEANLQDVTGTRFSLANEAAFSRSTSPFKSVGTLTDYIWELVSAGATA